MAVPEVRPVASMRTRTQPQNASRETQALAAANRRISAYGAAMRDLRESVQFLIQANERLLTGKPLADEDAGRLRLVALELFDAETILYG